MTSLGRQAGSTHVAINQSAELAPTKEKEDPVSNPRAALREHRARKDINKAVAGGDGTRSSRTRPFGHKAPGPAGPWGTKG